MDLTRPKARIRARTPFACWAWRCPECRAHLVTCQSANVAPRSPRMPAPSIVEFRDVIKRFGDGPLVLDRVNLAAQPGEFISLIGPSGCGKSTLLRLIAGLSPVSSGTLTVDGLTPDAAAAELAFVFQEPT